ncbi:four helix bundle protein [Candidatus Woesearchaeota archaeon]|nr:four helix bundle protein [Candidatus Woesearchaeota archaeon]|tara:strand:+ start:8298 stop:8654 length:357 start_codon:yes stop_codon:yes gene_type:complete
MAQNYKQLRIWKRSFELALKVYKITAKFPKSEKYNLTAQIRRAATSISTNIAEGASRHTARDFIRFLHQSYGSLKEAENLLLLSKELKYLLVKDFQPLQKEIDEIARMIYRFIERIKG